MIITPIDQIDREISNNTMEIESKTDINTLWDEDPIVNDITIEKHKFSSNFDGFKQLYDVYRGIQSGSTKDHYNWMYPREGI